MAEYGHRIDEWVKDAVLRFPTVELIKKLFPSVQMRGRSCMCNPLREDRKPSLSCYAGSSGYPRWKDHATGEGGDNIAFFRKAFPELSYTEAVDRLAWMLLGRSAFEEVGDRARRPSAPLPSPAKAAHVPARELESSLQVVSDEPLVPSVSSPLLVSYWRERGISDQVAAAYGRRVVFENVNRAGRVLRDEETGQMVVGADGEPILDDGRYEAVALRNDIGGFSFRVPDGPVRAGVKRSNMLFITTLYADGSVPRRRVVFAGRGDGQVSAPSYDEASRFLYVNPVQGFTCVEPWTARYAMPFLERWRGRYLEGRDLKKAVAVLDSLNGPLNPVVTVVEGLFDGLSVIEMQRMAGNPAVPGTDLLVLNSVSNISWAVPFLAVHREVRSLLDNDMLSNAGQKAFVQLQEQVAGYAAKCGGECFVRSDSGLIYPDKDVNDYLKRRKGLPQRKDVVKDVSPVMPAPVTARPGEPEKVKQMKL